MIYSIANLKLESGSLYSVLFGNWETLYRIKDERVDYNNQLKSEPIIHFSKLVIYISPALKNVSSNQR